MSRIGNSPISIPEGVTVDVKDGVVTVKGKLGEMSQPVDGIAINMEEGVISLERSSEAKDHRAKHGLYRALINNMIVGVSKGWTKELNRPFPKNRGLCFLCFFVSPTAGV